MEKEHYKIFEPIIEWCDRNFYADMIVTIKADNNIITTILYCSSLIGDSINYEFLDDWYEGEENISLVGFFPLSHIEVHSNPDSVHFVVEI